jgi:beta-lactamase class A
MNRRNVLGLLTASMLMPACRAVAPHQTGEDVAAGLRQLESKAGGRLGVSFLDTVTGRMLGNRLDERFALCSTFKLLLAGAVLEAADAGRIALDERLRYGPDDMVGVSPITRENLARGSMTVEALSRATQTTSDNTAANLLLRRLGGPQALTDILRRWGDSATRLDRYEPEMSRMRPGDPRDTTTPRAMAQTVSRLLTGPLLKPDSRDRLIGWMEETRTGLKRLRAGFPADWRAGDKTGTGFGSGITDKLNDVAIAWPTGRPPIIIACYYDTPRFSDDIRDEDQAVLAEVGRIAARWLMRPADRVSAEFRHNPLALIRADRAFRVNPALGPEWEG